MILKRLVLIVTLLSSLAFGQIARSAANCTGTSSCTTTGNAIGDLEIAYAGINLSATAPTTATGWTSVGTSSINGTSTADSAVRMACKVATGTSEASNTFTNATSLIIMVYSGQRAGTTTTCASVILGTPVFTASTVNTTTTTETFGLVTNGDASSWDVGFGYCSACTVAIATAPTNMANRSSITGPPGMGGHDTNATRSSFPSANVTLTTAGRVITGVVEIKAAQVATPIFSLNGGTFGTSASETLSDTTPGAGICYTIDGTTPAATTPGTCSTGSTYSSAFAITISGATVNALGTRSALSNSAVVTSSAFTIDAFLPSLGLLGVSGPGLPGQVAFDATISGGNGGSGDAEQASGVTTISSTHLTLGGSATCLVVALGLSGGASAFSATWNGTPMALGPSAISAVAGQESAILYLTNPATGNNTLTASWSGSADVYMGAVSFKGTSTTACVNAADNVTTTAGAATSQIVTSSTDGATVASYCGNSASPTMNFNQVWKDQALAPGGGGSYQLGGTSNTHTFTGSGAVGAAIVGVHVVH